MFLKEKFSNQQTVSVLFVFHRHLKYRLIQKAAVEKINAKLPTLKLDTFDESMCNIIELENTPFMIYELNDKSIIPLIISKE